MTNYHVGRRRLLKAFGLTAAAGPLAMSQADAVLGASLGHDEQIGVSPSEYRAPVNLARSTDAKAVAIGWIDANAAAITNLSDEVCPTYGAGHGDAHNLLGAGSVAAAIAVSRADSSRGVMWEVLMAVHPRSARVVSALFDSCHSGSPGLPSVARPAVPTACLLAVDPRERLECLSDGRRDQRRQRRFVTLRRTMKLSWTTSSCVPWDETELIVIYTAAGLSDARCFGLALLMSAGQC
ncbi:hypothetical protein HPO96_05190 [Kribbella sandramycini]|uniref:Subtilase family protein n=1 Tax=Kribbella sandramycini TaxID=60450 RepID=A0A7Y4NYY7_9ACTN|nr:hypothetical protein [Kribbella sandramycini]MBB6567769.1 hypothetical protein [Kribbella sandramycini]NOL39635.1 hypothetical protein [Kribbella sandramycini]